MDTVTHSRSVSESIRFLLTHWDKEIEGHDLRTIYDEYDFADRVTFDNFRRMFVRIIANNPDWNIISEGKTLILDREEKAKVQFAEFEIYVEWAKSTNHPVAKYLKYSGDSWKMEQFLDLLKEFHNQ